VLRTRLLDDALRAREHGPHETKALRVGPAQDGEMPWFLCCSPMYTCAGQDSKVRSRPPSYVPNTCLKYTRAAIAHQLRDLTVLSICVAAWRMVCVSAPGAMLPVIPPTPCKHHARVMCRTQGRTKVRIRCCLAHAGEQRMAGMHVRQCSKEGKRGAPRCPCCP